MLAWCFPFFSVPSHRSGLPWLRLVNPLFTPFALPEMLPFSYAVRNALRDPWKLFQKIVGACLVVFLMFAASSFNEGMESLLRTSGDPKNVILLGAGSEESVERSEVALQAEEQAAQQALVLTQTNRQGQSYL